MSVVDGEEPERPEGAVEVALWCGRCLLPSGIRWPVFAASARDRRPRQVGTVVLCQDCGATLGPDGEVLP